ncbi:MAG: ParB/RepB/Spo0J family partition protein [Granulosicoccus sp.]
MAKKRMGRNLDALLGGASRERATSASSADKPSEDVAADAASADSGAQTGSQPTETRPGNARPVLREVSSIDVNTAPPATSPEEPESDPAARGVASDRLRIIGVDQIRRGTYQPRRLFDQELLQELADSLKAEGMIQPIIVRPFGDAYELVAGERRWRAAQLAGFSEVPAIIREMEDKSVAAVSIIENIQRKDLNPLEEAAAFERLCDEFGMTHKAVAESVGRSRASVTNLMRLLELHAEVKVLVDKGELEMGHARALLGAPVSRQHELAQRIVKQGLTVRAVEKLVRSLDEDGNEPAKNAGSTMADPDIERLSKKLGDTLGAAVRIQHKPTGAGKLEINYSSVAELQGILAHIK